MSGLGLRFFIISGVVLMVSGVLQALVRPRKSGESPGQRFVNRSTVWAFLCVTVGLLGVLVGTGVVPLVPLR